LSPDKLYLPNPQGGVGRGRIPESEQMLSSTVLEYVRVWGLGKERKKQVQAMLKGKILDSVSLFAWLFNKFLYLQIGCVGVCKSADSRALGVVS